MKSAAFLSLLFSAAAAVVTEDGAHALESICVGSSVGVSYIRVHLQWF